MNDNGKRKIARLINQFGFNEVYTASEIAIDRYYKGTETSWQSAFDKVGGVCYNRKHGITGNEKYCKNPDVQKGD